MVNIDDEIQGGLPGFAEDITFGEWRIREAEGRGVIPCNYCGRIDALCDYCDGVDDGDGGEEALRRLRDENPNIDAALRTLEGGRRCLTAQQPITPARTATDAVRARLTGVSISPS